MFFFTDLIEEIQRNNQSHVKFLANALIQLTDEEKRVLTTYITFLVEEEGKAIPYIAECYNTLVRDIGKEQLYFMKHKKYRFSSFSEVESKVYSNDQFMEKYMIGLAISTFLWPQHLKIHRFFLEKLPRNVSGQYLEIGPGHGFYFMDAMNKTAYTFFEGIDISPKSISLTNRIVNSDLFGRFDNYLLHEADFTQFNPDNTYDAIVMGEVLEHVENPIILLNKIHSIAKMDSFIFITTVINAPAIDHIYLFDNITSITELISKSNFSIKELFLAPASEKLSIDKNLEKKFPIDVAIILCKNRGL